MSKELRTIKHRCKNRKDKKAIKEAILDYAQLNNLLLLLLNSTLPQKQDYPNEETYFAQYNLWFNLSNKVIMKAILKGNQGGEKTNEAIAETLNAFKDNEFLQSAIEHCKEKKINGHNASMLVERIKKDFSNTFKKIKAGEKASFPKPKKLRNHYQFSVPFEPSKFSVKEKRHIKLTFFDKFIRVFFPRKWKLNDKDINNVTVGFYHSDVYINVSYHHNEDKQQEKTMLLNHGQKKIRKNAKKKCAGLDVGICNTFALFIDDTSTQSLLFSGKKFIQKNCSYNKEIAKCQEAKKHYVINYKEIKQSDNNTVLIPSEYTQCNQYQYIKNKIARMFANRERFFNGEFEKLASQVVKYLRTHNVTHLAISKNLQFLKNTENKHSNLRKKDKQKFYQIPFGKLLNLIESKCGQVGIIVEDIDEAYTSKTSVLSQDVNEVLLNTSMDKKGYRGVKHNKNKLSTKDRGLFKDTNLNIIYNSDVGAAGNHVKVAFNQSLDYLKSCLHKVCNPILIKSTDEFDSLLQGLRIVAVAG